MNHYLLSIQQPDGGPPPPEVIEPIMRRVQEFNDELRASGAWVFAGGLELAHAAAVARPGEAMVTDGPYTEGKEHVGGLSIIAVPDPEVARKWGRKLAAATGLPVEVRGFQGEASDHLP
ncbi:MAG TPA: YciI family protein [Mycobacteriales bacterium]|nr:YciI family protein [Mycobacteriales bacterium]